MPAHLSLRKSNMNTQMQALVRDRLTFKGDEQTCTILKHWGVSEKNHTEKN